MNPNIISQISKGFIKSYRITIILIIVFITFGFFAYVNLLKREGFPVIEIPVVVIQTPYLSGDINVTEREVTQKINEAVRDIREIRSIESVSSENSSSVILRLDENADRNQIFKEVQSKISTIKDFSAQLSPIVILPDASKIDGVNDLIFSIYANDKSDKELQVLGELFVNELKKSNLVNTASVIKQYEERFDFMSGETNEVNTSFSRVGVREGDEFNFYTAVNIGVVKGSSEVESIKFSDEVRRILNKTKNDNQALSDIGFSFGGDIADSLKSQISSLERNAIAAIITIVTVLFFLINLRASVILGFFIPLVLGTVFFTFYLLGYSLNTISLFALILVLGLFVDDGIVVAEAIDYYKRKGQKGLEAVIKAINDIGVANISGTLTTILVFFPLLFVSGILGDFIKILPLTVIVSLLVSIVLAITVLPFISNLVIPNRSNVASLRNGGILYKILNFFPNLIIKASELASRFVSLTISKGLFVFITVVISMSLIIFGVSFASRLSFEFFAQAKDADSISISITLPSNEDIDIVRNKSIELEQIILEEFPDIIEKIDYRRGGSSSSNLNVKLTPINTRNISASSMVANINEMAKSIEGVNINATSVVAGPPAQQFPFAMQIFSDSQIDLERSSKIIREFIANQDLNNNVKAEEVVIQNLQTISKIDNKRFVEISVSFFGDSDSATLLELREKIENKFNKYYLEENGLSNVELGFDFGQESENAESFNSVIVASFVALVLMYIILVFQFNSFSQPVLVLLSIPFSFVGLFPGLFLTNNPLSFFVVVGFTGLIGIVVNNTIMLVEYANSLRRNGKGIVESISEAIRLRFRPILATSTTTIAGLLPLALSEPFWEPLAFTIIFGLFSSVVMVIFTFPSFYYISEKVRELRQKFFNRYFNVVEKEK